MFMSTAPLPVPSATSRQHDMLDDLSGLGHRLVRLTVDQAEAGTIPLAQATLGYDRVCRNIRRNILLTRELAKPIKTTDRVAARKRIIREVEDSIQRNADEDEAETLHGELLDRLDNLDLDDEIDGRPVKDIIEDIVRDLGLAHIPGTHPWKRRTPDDLAELHARASQAGVERTPVLSQGSKGQRPLAFPLLL
jgi:hypothetical protein